MSWNSSIKGRADAAERSVAYIRILLARARKLTNGRGLNKKMNLQSEEKKECKVRVGGGDDSDGTSRERHNPGEDLVESKPEVRERNASKKSRRWILGLRMEERKLRLRTSYIGCD